MTDLYAENYNSKIKKYIQHIIFKKSKNIFCITNDLNSYYSKKWKKVYTIPHIIKSIQLKNSKIDKNFFSIAYVGSINNDRIQLLKNLVSIVKKYNDFKLTLFTHHDHNFLKKSELLGKNIDIMFFDSKDKLLNKLSEYNLMYLPLSFKKVSNSTYLQIKTAFATKSIEYLQSRRPILVNANYDTFTYKYFHYHKAAFCLSSDNPEELEKLLFNFKNNKLDTKKVLKNALKLLEKHSEDIVAKKIRKQINKIEK